MRRLGELHELRVRRELLCVTVVLIGAGTRPLDAIAGLLLLLHELRVLRELHRVVVELTDVVAPLLDALAETA